MRGIGIIGRARSGKDTVAARLVAAHGFRRMALADPLKDMAFGIDPLIAPAVQDGGTLRLAEAVRLFGWETVKERYPEARRFLQRLGTEGVRHHINANYWVDVLLQEAGTACRAGDVRPVVVPDVRFENEARALAAHGFALWSVDRPGLRDTVHESERLSLHHGELLINNNGTLAALHRQVDAAMEQTRKSRCDTY
ncbi:hypothetical protein EKH77_02800 [Streptomyces luteoverticillatus]|uniref:DNMP kinase n=1 Tax=Streptomyces luteoverticillatus TaxID=66425 RepID=A0A3S9PD33_STRLT|nr:hypothetical protein [Streptomyces luteoverticillatus]AZQ70285.1 hypothetical protein EKH77_02800 [Streptomyces luteoverticillatus]